MASEWLKAKATDAYEIMLNRSQGAQPLSVALRQKRGGERPSEPEPTFRGAGLVWDAVSSVGRGCTSRSAAVAFTAPFTICQCPHAQYKLSLHSISTGRLTMGLFVFMSDILIIKARSPAILCDHKHPRIAWAPDHGAWPTRTCLPAPAPFLRDPCPRLSLWTAGG